MKKIVMVEKLVENVLDLCIKHIAAVANACNPDDYTREGAMMTLDLMPRESRGYWKHHAPGKWFKQAKDFSKDQ